MLVAFLVLGGFVFLILVVPMWLITRRGRHVVGPVTEHLNYEQPYPGLGVFATRKGMGDSAHATRKNW